MGTTELEFKSNKVSNHTFHEKVSFDGSILALEIRKPGKRNFAKW